MGEAFIRAERPYASRVEYARDLARLIREGGPVPGDANPRWCVDPRSIDPGTGAVRQREILATPAEAAGSGCLDCKKLVILHGRKALEAGHLVEVVMSMASEVAHWWLRINGIPFDPSVAAGMPPLPPEETRWAVIVRV